MADTTEEQPELLVTRRSKRSTAGNRMEAALAEMALEEANMKELDDDNDFVNDKVEEDEFGSDFESTDEEAENQANEAGENEVLQEERMVKRSARTRLEKITAAAHAKNRTSFNPDIQLSADPKPKLKIKRVVVGKAVDAESGDIVAQSKKDDADGNKRTSQRKHTMQNTTATVTRLKQVQARRAAQPKKAKIEYKTYTQAELIALALDTEEGNIVDHRDYLKNEAEKRKRARVVRTTVEGPLLRWISRVEEVKVEVPPLPSPPPISAPVPALTSVTPITSTQIIASTSSTSTSTPAPFVSPFSSTLTPGPTSSLAYAPSTMSRSIYGPPGTLFTPTTYSYTAGMAVVSTNASTSAAPSQVNTPPLTTFFHYQPFVDPAASPFPTWPPVSPVQTPLTTAIPPPAPSTVTTASVLSTTTPPVLTSTPADPVDGTSQQQPTLPATPNPVEQPVQPLPITETEPPQPPPPPEPEYRLEKVTKNYVVHELAQQKGTPKPTWTQSMQSMFGDHVKWDQIKVFVGKGRPLSRPRQLCPITGRQAHYMDPRSGVPYADAYAYKVLTGLLKHEYVWDTELACYLNHEPLPPDGASGNDDQMEVDESVV
ncbi:hypothetical protein JR316_0001309 [Psilocybe cubensis]|uniref:Vps72/YL1 C-terminal domain-containing protein n=2 Tax=Psilocybe cubensis TaxID=181762 RepID=A0A8H7YBK6_PSICU|nr:hypothetical protein JR316_0001309 [Psilocybe cubensis]KAH9487240.1 hypothetical protein JR316_0001309 [Psilocybe cubensis]